MDFVASQFIFHCMSFFVLRQETGNMATSFQLQSITQLKDWEIGKENYRVSHQYECGFYGIFGWFL